MRRRVIAGLTLLALTTGVVALRLTNASPVLRTVLSATFPRAVVVDERHRRTYVIGSDRMGGHVWALDPATGQVLMTVTTADTPGGVAVDARHAHLFVAGGTSPTVNMYDARTGALLHTVSVGGWPQGASFMGRELVVSEPSGRVFVANPYGGVNGSAIYSTVNVLDTTSERMLRTVAVGQGLTTLLSDERSNHVFGINNVDNTVSMLDASTGTVLHTIPVHSHPLALAVDERSEHVFVTSNMLSAGAASVSTRGHVDMLDARTGALLHSVSVGILPLAAAVDERQGRVFVANSGSNTVSMLDARTGKVVRTVRVGRNPAAIAVDSQAGRVVVVNSARPYLFPDRAGGAHGSVSILDASSGTVLSTIPVGVAPAAVAVDESAGRAFVVNSGAERQVHVRDGWAWLPRWLRTHLPFLATEPVRTVPAGSLSVLDIAR